MAPMASPQTITIISNARLLSVTKPDQAPPMPALPKYAVGLFDSKNGPGPRKRKRLTHLTPEEKIMRRKLKNRVAAQTARDRKKMRMETLEETLQKVQNQARELLNVNMQLLARAETLENENKTLRKKLGMNNLNTKTESTDSSKHVIGQQKQNLDRIKREFDETLQQNLLVDDKSNITDDVQIPDSILSPDESSADENESSPKSSSRKRKSLNRDTTVTTSTKRNRNDVITIVDDVIATTDVTNDVMCDVVKRESLMPAAHEEHGHYDVVHPQQQVVTPLKPPLIRSTAPHTLPHQLPSVVTSHQQTLRHHMMTSPRCYHSPQQMNFSDYSMKSQTITNQTAIVAPLDLRRK